MTTTKNKGPPSSTLVMTALVPRNIPSSKTRTPRSPFASGAQSVHPTPATFRCATRRPFQPFSRTSRRPYSESTCDTPYCAQRGPMMQAKGEKLEHLGTIGGSGGKTWDLTTRVPASGGRGPGRPASWWPSWGFQSWSSGPQRRAVDTSRTRYSWSSWR